MVLTVVLKRCLGHLDQLSSSVGNSEPREEKEVLVNNRREEEIGGQTYKKRQTDGYVERRVDRKGNRVKEIDRPNGNTNVGDCQRHKARLLF